MKRSMLVTMSVLMALSASTATAAVRANEVRTKMEKEIKESQARIKSQKPDLIHQEVVKDMVALAKGGVGTVELRQALKRTLTFKEGDKTVTVTGLDIAISLKATKESLDKINRNELDADAVKLIEQKERALNVGAKFLTLLARTPIQGAHVPNLRNVDVLAKEMSLLPEIVTTMDAAQAKSHIDMMELAVEKTLRSPELLGDEAFYQVLKEKFGAKTEAKIDEILGCARG